MQLKAGLAATNEDYAFSSLDFSSVILQSKLQKLSTQYYTVLTHPSRTYV
ncbi:hypothetical protein GCM10009098_37010 [Rheinheimera aquimaris]|uniref:Uncharacterized protein n=1 Tax=Rheinheimera aquimaris TaxID=412437 RepID=A0ABP3PDQ0_9GAMM